MRPNGARVVSDIRVKNKRMSHKQLTRIQGWCVCLLLASILFSCGSSRKVSIPSKNTLAQVDVDPLTLEERRKFNNYLLEAVRLKEKGEMDAAFDMYSHCLAIDSGSAVT